MPADGSATIRVGRVGHEAMFSAATGPGTFSRTRRGRGMVSRSGWTLIEDALVAANFWMLDEQEEERLLVGGARWYVAGRRTGRLFTL